MDHYAEWIKEHPESDTSRYDYDRDKDDYYWDQRNIKEGKRKEDVAWYEQPFEDQLQAWFYPYELELADDVGV